MNKNLFGIIGCLLAVMLKFCKITAGCNFKYQLLHTRFCLFSVSWIKATGMIHIPIMFCPLTVDLVYSKQHVSKKNPIERRKEMSEFV